MSTAASSCVYAPSNGIYFSTYGGLLQRSDVSSSALRLLDEVLAFPQVAGIAHYQNWSTLEPVDGGAYNWTVLDAVFAAASRAQKSVILGLQQGVAAPAWLLRKSKTYTFVHANAGWNHWASLQSHAHDGTPLITAAVPWSDSSNPIYFRAVEEVVHAMANRYAQHPALAYVNVCGISASAGVEANFNVDYARSRSVLGGAAWDETLNFTLATYEQAWKNRIDLYLDAFAAPVRVGMATHDQNGDWGWSPQSSTAVQYTAAQRMATARAIRDHLVAATGQGRRPSAVVRCCGGSNNTRVWGGASTRSRGSSSRRSNFAQLLWEVKDVAEIGFEEASVQRLAHATNITAMLEIERSYNGRYLEFKTPDLVNDDVRGKPYAPFVPALLAATRAMQPGLALPQPCNTQRLIMVERATVGLETLLQ